MGLAGMLCVVMWRPFSEIMVHLWIRLLYVAGTFCNAERVWGVCGIHTVGHAVTYCVTQLDML